MRTAIMIGVALLAGLLATQEACAQKSALEHHQFDGVSSDGELKVEGHSRREWLALYPVQAKEYWNAWDCKGKPCDSQRKANIRKKAALIKRTDKDPLPPPAAPKR